MDGRRGRRGRSNPTVLPLRSSASQLSNTVSCWYCDFKFSILNEPFFHFGRRYSRWFRVWFSMGIGFSMAALVGVTVILLCELGALLVYRGNTFFGLPSLFTGLNISFPSFVYLCVSSIVSVIFHEFGHALAAASEGVRIEYIAIFLAVFFPGALVAFNHASLQALPAVASLRVYCAGIWHNAVFCAVCTFVLFLLPYFLSPFYTNGDCPMVMDVALSSPLSGYISPRDVIVSLDDTRVHTTEEWKRIILLLTEQTKSLSSYQSSGIAVGNKGYCVPHSLIQGSTHSLGKENEPKCRNELTAFVSDPCLNSSEHDNNEPDINLPKRWESIQCLDAKDVVKLKKCIFNKMETPTNKSGCVCSEVESCLAPVQQPGQQWVEIKFSSLDCQNIGRNSDPTDSISPERRSCLETYVFVGDLISMAHSIHLTSYQPRRYVEFAPYLPNTLERFLTCSFHVSMLLALLNSLPVYFLDGESILEGIVDHNFVSLNPSKKRLILRCCLLGGTIVSVTLFLQMVLHIVVYPMPL